MHIHSKFSDGKFDVQDIIHMSQKKGLDKIIITDHDSIDAYRHHLKYLDISGMEITCSFEPEIHILAYGFNIEDININKYCDKFKKFKYFRTLHFLNRISIDYNIDSFDFFKNDNINIDAIYNYLVDKGIYKNIVNAKKDFMINYKEYFVKKPLINAYDAIDMIKNASGYTSIAHINRIKINDFELDQLIRNLKNAGLDAIEIYNSCYSHIEIKKALSFSKKYNLNITGGSDFHGSFKNYNLIKLPYIIKEKKLFINPETYK